VSGKERRVKFGRENKNGKRNDPGKAQSIYGCGAEVKALQGFLVSVQARFIFQAHVRGGGATASCGTKLYGKRWKERWNRESGGVWS
jgi:hypothetical protein